MKITTIHQPHFLPWIGYFNKLLNSDIFIVLDDVQFRRRYYQNRTDIISSNGMRIKQTVPLVYKKRETLIKDMIIYNFEEWKDRFIKTIEYSYKKSPFFHVVFEMIKNNINSSRLLDLNMELIKAILQYLNKDIEIVYSSNYNTSNTPTQKLIDLCIATYSDTYIFGEGNGMNYHNLELFHLNGIKIIQQSFLSNHPTYKQKTDTFVSGISVIDLLFNESSWKAKEIILNSWKINN